MLNILLSLQSFLGDKGVTWLGGWLPLCVLAVMTAIIIHAVLLMLGRSFRIRELENFATAEIMQALATAFMAIFLIVMLESALGISAALIHGELTCQGKTMEIAGAAKINAGQTTAMDAAYDAIKCRLNERAVNVARVQDEAVNAAIGDFMLLNLQVSVFGITAWKGDWESGTYKRTETYRITNNLATLLLIGLNAQYAIAEYIRVNMLHVFIPLGLLLRSLYFTRGPGALFMALGIGMYFIFPVVYILLDPGFVAIPLPPAAPPMPPPQFCYATMSSAASLITTMETQGAGSTTGLNFQNAQDDLKKSYISLMLHPLVALFITLVFVRYIMTILGGDPYDLMKMVSKVV